MELKSALNVRFSSRMRCDLILRNIYSNFPKTITEFYDLMEKLTYFFNKNYLTSEALCDIIISKSPKEMKTILWQAKALNKSWPEICKMSEELAGVVFNDTDDKKLLIKPYNDTEILENNEEFQIGSCKVNKF